MDTLTNAEPRTLARRLAERIGRSIAAGELPGGAVLDPAALCAQHGVGRGTVREALAALSAQGMVHARAGRPACVAALAQRNLLDPQVLAWHAEGGTLGQDAADLAANLPTLAAILPDNRLVAALLRALKLEPDPFLVELSASDAYPLPVALCLTSDGIPLAEIDPGDMPDRDAPRDLHGNPYGIVTIGGREVYRHEPPPPICDEHGVRLPARRWIEQRVHGEAELVSAALREHLAVHPAQDAQDAALTIARWARQIDPDTQLLPAGGAHDVLDQVVHVVRFENPGPGGGPVAAVITTAEQVDAPPYAVTAYRDVAGPTPWRERDRWQADCDNGHRFRHCDGQVRAGNIRQPAAAAWPNGPMLRTEWGVWVVRCPRCDAPARPETPDL